MKNRRTRLTEDADLLPKGTSILQSFWESPTLQELAKSQEAQPVADVRALSGTGARRQERWLCGGETEARLRLTLPQADVLLDTNVASDLMQGGRFADAYARQVPGRLLAITFMTVDEFYFGAEKATWDKTKRRQLVELTT